jgi:hypothetical protein
MVKLNGMKKDKKIIFQYLKKYKSDESEFFINRYDYLEELLYKIIFFNKFQEQIGITNKVKLFYFLSCDDVKYIFSNYNNLLKILKYMISKY